MNYSCCFMLVLICGLQVIEIESHGRLIQPPGRSTLWRYNSLAPKNYDDDALNCGHFGNQYVKNGGKCGPCGDDYSHPRPRDNENTGKYGIMTSKAFYTEGQIIELGVEVTTNHLGHFEFRLCKLLDPTKPEPEDCFEHILYPVDLDTYKYQIGKTTGKMYLDYYLPPGLTCDHCVIQWRYIAGNNHGMCDDGTYKLGCGNQEEFRACADLVITPAKTTPAKTTEEKKKTNRIKAKGSDL